MTLLQDYDEDFDMKLSEEEVKKMIEHRFQLKPGANFARIFRSFDSNKDGGLDIDGWFSDHVFIYELIR